MNAGQGGGAPRGRRQNGVGAKRSDQVYDELKKRIINNELRPGEALPESFVSELLGASRTPVREALQRLAREGLVTFAPGRGASVTPISIPDIVELYQMREALEPYAARLAAANPDRKVVEPLLDRLQTAEQLIATEVDSYYKLTGEIDECLSGLTGNTRLQVALQEVWTQVRRARHLSAKYPDRLASSVREHIRLLEAVRRGDAEEAAAASRAHVVMSLGHILSTTSPAFGMPGEVIPLHFQENDS